MGLDDEARWLERERYHRDMAASADSAAVRIAHEAMADAYKAKLETIAGKSNTG